MSEIEEAQTPIIRRIASRRWFFCSQAEKKSQKSNAYVGAVQNALSRKTLEIRLSKCNLSSGAVEKKTISGSRLMQKLEKKTGEVFTSVNDKVTDDIQKDVTCNQNTRMDIKKTLTDLREINNELDDVFANSVSGSSSIEPFNNTITKPWSKPMVCLHEGALDILPERVHKHLKRRMIYSNGKPKCSWDSSEEPVALPDQNQSEISSDMPGKTLSSYPKTDDASSRLTEIHFDRMQTVEFNETQSCSKNCIVAEVNLEVPSNGLDAEPALCSKFTNHSKKLSRSLEINIFPPQSFHWIEEKHMEESDNILSCLLSSDSECKTRELCRKTEANRKIIDSVLCSNCDMNLTDVTLQECAQGLSLHGEESEHLNSGVDIPFLSSTISKYSELLENKEESDEMSDLSPHIIKHIDFLESNLASESNPDLPPLSAEYSNCLPKQTPCKDFSDLSQSSSKSLVCVEEIASGKLVHYQSPCTSEYNLSTPKQERNVTDNEVTAVSVDKPVAFKDATHPVPSSSEYLEIMDETALDKDSPSIFQCISGHEDITEDLDSAFNKLVTYVTVRDSFNADLKRRVESGDSLSLLAYNNESLNLPEKLGSDNITLTSVTPVNYCKPEVGFNNSLDKEEDSFVSTAVEKVTSGAVYGNKKTGLNKCNKVNENFTKMQRNPAIPEANNVGKVIEEVIAKYTTSSLECSVPIYRKSTASKSNTVDEIIEAVIAGNMSNGLNCDGSLMMYQSQPKTNEHDFFIKTLVPVKQQEHKKPPLCASAPKVRAQSNYMARKISHLSDLKCKSIERSNFECAEVPTAVSPVHFEEQACKRPLLNTPSVDTRKCTSSCLPKSSENQDFKSFSSVLDKLPLLSQLLFAKGGSTKTLVSSAVNHHDSDDTCTPDKCTLNKSKETPNKTLGKKECIAFKKTLCDFEKDSQAAAGNNLKTDCKVVLSDVFSTEHMKSTAYAKGAKLSKKVPNGVFISSALDEYDFSRLQMIGNCDYSIKTRKASCVDIGDHLIKKLNIDFADKEESPLCLQAKTTESNLTDSLPLPARLTALSLESTIRSTPSAESSTVWLSPSLKCARTDVVPLRKGKRDIDNFDMKTPSLRYVSQKKGRKRNMNIEESEVKNKNIKAEVATMMAISSGFKDMNTDKHCKKLDSLAEISKCKRDRKRKLPVAAQIEEGNKMNKKNIANAKRETECVPENEERLNTVHPHKQIVKQVDVKAELITKTKSRTEKSNVDEVNRKKIECEKQESRNRSTLRQTNAARKRSKEDKENVDPTECKHNRKSLKHHKIEMGSMLSEELEENHHKWNANRSKEHEKGLKVSNLGNIPKAIDALSGDSILVNKVKKAKVMNRNDKNEPKANEGNNVNGIKKGTYSPIPRIGESTFKSSKENKQLENGNRYGTQSWGRNTILSCKEEQVRDTNQESQESSLEDFCVTDKFKTSNSIRLKKENGTGKRISLFPEVNGTRKPFKPKKKRQTGFNLVFNLPKSMGKYKSQCKKAPSKDI